MIPKFRICDCCGKTIDLNDGKTHTEWSEHTTYCDPVSIVDYKYFKGCCLIDFVFEQHSKGSSRTVVPHNCKADLCDECKLMLLKNAANRLEHKIKFESSKHEA